MSMFYDERTAEQLIEDSIANHKDEIQRKQESAENQLKTLVGRYVDISRHQDMIKQLERDLATLRGEV